MCTIFCEDEHNCQDIFDVDAFSVRFFVNFPSHSRAHAVLSNVWRAHRIDGERKKIIILTLKMKSWHRTCFIAIFHFFVRFSFQSEYGLTEEQVAGMLSAKTKIRQFCETVKIQSECVAIECEKWDKENRNKLRSRSFGRLCFALPDLLSTERP